MDSMLQPALLPDPSTLFIERRGVGSTIIVFLHGWGMQRCLFYSLAEALGTRYQCWLIDLPGHGKSPAYQQAEDIQAYAEYLLGYLPQVPCVLCGWSMGALLALAMVQRCSARISKLLLFAATPCFTNTTEWSYGIDKTVLRQVAAELSQDYPRALTRFLGLQLKNLPRSRDYLRKIKSLLEYAPAPVVGALLQGLVLLENTDLHGVAATITLPTLIINGDRDPLVPSPAARVLAELLPNAKAVIVHGSGHLPFVTHQALCLGWIEAFLHE
ncbi:MAG: alpha/beta fold hydrolase [Gammaproteobacteria bacterium]|nr:alpha/beta fold hydrolase [Gammaproteobacteria bacterium]